MLREDIEAGDEAVLYAKASLSAYADSKVAAETRVLAFAAEGGTGPRAVHPYLVIGPSDRRFVPNFLRRTEGPGIREIGTRRKLSAYGYIDIVVGAVLAAEARLGPDPPTCGQAYLVTNGEAVAFFEFVHRLLVAIVCGLGRPGGQASARPRDASRTDIPSVPSAAA